MPPFLERNAGCCGLARPSDAEAPSAISLTRGDEARGTSVPFLTPQCLKPLWVVVFRVRKTDGRRPVFCAVSLGNEAHAESVSRAPAPRGATSRRPHGTPEGGGAVSPPCRRARGGDAQLGRPGGIRAPAQSPRPASPRPRREASRPAVPFRDGAPHP